MIHEDVVNAVDNAVLMSTSEGYISVLKALSALMASNPNADTQKAAKLVASLAEVLDEYLEEDEEEED
jgi:ATP/maltotriose-dependent transcriptional regulator MalT